MREASTLFGGAIGAEGFRADVVEDPLAVVVVSTSFRFELLHYPFSLDLVDDVGGPEEPF